jgi:hypothetical protein
MVYYDTDSRLQFAREHVERLADEMRRSQPLTPLDVEDSHRATLGSALLALVERLRHVKGYQAPAYHA